MLVTNGIGAIWEASKISTRVLSPPFGRIQHRWSQRNPHASWWARPDPSLDASARHSSEVRHRPHAQPLAIRRPVPCAELSLWYSPNTLAKTTCHAPLSHRLLQWHLLPAIAEHSASISADGNHWWHQQTLSNWSSCISAIDALLNQKHIEVKAKKQLLPPDIALDDML